MIKPLCTALHPLSFEFADYLSGPEGRYRQIAEWRRIHGATAETLPARLMGEHPLVASHRLQRELDIQVAELVSLVNARLPDSYASMQTWPGLPAPDVVCADLAIAADPSAPDGWTLRWVEFQAFPSVMSAIYTLHLAASELWPQSRGLAAWRLPEEERDWLSAVRKWAAPSGGILLESTPQKQLSWYDLQLAAKFLDLDIVEPHQLVRNGRSLGYRDAAGRYCDVHHVFNRLVMHELVDREAFERTIVATDVSWHAHPAWYYGISKRWLPYLPQPREARCTTAARWRTLGLSASALVAKNVNSHGGAAVHLHVDEHMLDTLANPDSWVVQPRYTPQPLFAARDGQPVFGEVRCIVAMPQGRAPWLVGQRVRLTRGEKTSASHVREAAGSGAAILYRPPGS
jgi:hypothetical protein